MILSGQLAPFAVLVISIITLAFSNWILSDASAGEEGNHVLQPVKSKYTVRDTGRVSRFQAEENSKRLLLTQNAALLPGYENPGVRPGEGYEYEWRH
jgi:hypothetical protein